LISWGTIGIDMTLLSRHVEPDRDHRADLDRPVTIRLAVREDAVAIAAVAGRDTRPIPPAPHLVAEQDGSIAAVLSLSSGELVADPFRPTAELAELVRCHAGGTHDRPDGRPARSAPLGPRLAEGCP
jgi:hypothetical protein